MEDPRCRGCNRKLVWGTTADKKRIPLDAVAPVYKVLGTYGAGENGEGADFKVTIIERAPDAFVSHFSTCPNANDFSGSRKKS